MHASTGSSLHYQLVYSRTFVHSGKEPCPCLRRTLRTGDRVRGAEWFHEIAGAVGTVVRAVEVNGDDWAAQDLLVRFDRPVVIFSEPQWTSFHSAHNFEFVDESRAAPVRQGPGFLHAYAWACAVCRSCSQAHALAKCSASPYFCARLCVAHKNARPACYTKRATKLLVQLYECSSNAPGPINPACYTTCATILPVQFDMPCNVAG